MSISYSTFDVATVVRGNASCLNACESSLRLTKTVVVAHTLEVVW